MKYFIAFLSMLVIVSCKTNNEKIMNRNKAYSFYVGTYTDSVSRGIYKYLLKEDGTLTQIGLAALSENPSFLTMSSNKKFLIAINEVNISGVGRVESFLVRDDSLEFISSSSSGGAHPCFVAINKVGYILTANYTGGNVGLLKLNPDDGKLSKLLDVKQHTGNGETERQKAPHAHSVWFEPNSDRIISIDLGTNELWFSYLNTESQKLLPSKQNKLKMEIGAGPRHLAFHPINNWIYVVNELNSTVTLIKKSDFDKYEIKTTVSTLPVGNSTPNTCADIRISSDGNFLYASNRGENSIAIFKVDNNNGLLNLIGHESTRGDGPRNFSLSPNNEYLLVANQHTNNIVSFKRNKITGLLNYVSKIEAPTPVCILF